MFQCVYQSLLISFHYFLSPSLLFYWSLHLFYYILLFLQHWRAKSMHNAHHTQQKECKWKQHSFSMSAHISRCMCTTWGVWESAYQGQGAQLLVRHPFLNGPVGMDQVLKNSGFPQLQIITLMTGACFTQDTSASTWLRSTVIAKTSYPGSNQEQGERKAAKR